MFAPYLARASHRAPRAGQRGMPQNLRYSFFTSEVSSGWAARLAIWRVRFVSNFNKLIDARRAKTGESYVTARRHVLAQAAPRASVAPTVADGGDGTPGEQAGAPAGADAVRDARAVEISRQLLEFLDPIRKRMALFEISPEGRRLQKVVVDLRRSPAAGLFRQLQQNSARIAASPEAQELRRWFLGLEARPEVRELLKGIAASPQRQP